MPGLVARLGQDCATRVRVLYRADRPLTLEDADFLPGAVRAVTEFSLFVSGARDHVKLTLGSEVVASYALESNELVVAYGKLGGRVQRPLLEAVERHLAAWFGDVTYATAVTRAAS